MADVSWEKEIFVQSGRKWSHWCVCGGGSVYQLEGNRLNMIFMQVSSVSDVQGSENKGAISQ